MTKLMTHLVAGYPTLEDSYELGLAMAEAGADFIEIQIPFSDPIADGPVIAEANRIALQNGTTPRDAFKLMRRLREKIATPLLFMSYYNIPFHYGLERFCQEAKASGAYGLILPDIPFDEADDAYTEICHRNGLHPIPVVSPLTPDERLASILPMASGFVYCVSRFGVTGSSNGFSQNFDEMKTYLQRVKKHTALPLALGFGISSKAPLQELANNADIFVIGSHMMKLCDQEGIEAVKTFIEEL